jgi:hypothetical protein
LTVATATPSCGTSSDPATEQPLPAGSVSARLTAEDHRLRAITEAAHQATVCEVADWYGWSWWHAPDNRPVRARSGRTYVQNIRRGLPDLILCRGPRLIFAELKTETGRVKTEQAEALAALSRAGAETYLWRPSDLPAIEATLAHPTPREDWT